ncbi:MAG: hypothetical protein H7A01_13430 [Hahellaceae bacterium]|nr:hypothetical protein [Hahellaceae bacterium]MCP5209679.1 hypothetical protein [Hahellaceae bacterium]
MAVGEMVQKYIFFLKLGRKEYILINSGTSDFCIMPLRYRVGEGKGDADTKKNTYVYSRSVLPRYSAWYSSFFNNDDESYLGCIAEGLSVMKKGFKNSGE